jgi:hypothetical protein
MSNPTVSLGFQENNMKILAVSGSTREASTNTALLKAIKKRAPVGVELVVIHNLSALPVFSPDSEGESTPLAVNKFLEAVSQSDGIIISSLCHILWHPKTIEPNEHRNITMHRLNLALHLSTVLVFPMEIREKYLLNRSTFLRTFLLLITAFLRVDNWMIFLVHHKILNFHKSTAL